MRRIALLAVVVGSLAAAATAWAVTNTLSYTVALKKAAGKPSSKKPVPVSYTALLHIDTDPAGQQPDTAPVTSIYVAKQIKQNAKLLPGCSVADIDGKPAIPSKCTKGKVGTGTASALAGTPGSPSSNSVKEDLNVTVINGKRGRQLLLVLNSKPGAPVAITNRVVPGDLAKASAPFGYRVDFKIPPDLQTQLGLSISLTDFKVAINNKTHTVIVNGKKKSVSFFGLTACGEAPVRAVAHFKNTSGATTDVTSDSKTKAC